MTPTGSIRRPVRWLARGAVGLWDLVRLALRRDRVMIPAWVLGLGLAVALASGRSVRGALDALARWGASSGLDQSAGFAAAIRACALVGAGAR